MKYPPAVIERARKIKVLVLDVDGVLTDGRIVYGTYGDEIKNFNVNDGLGIMLVKRAGLKCVILTAKASRCVTKRARELGIDKVYHNFHYKFLALGKIKKKFRVSEEEIAFVGDDIIDIPVLKRIGLAVAPPNAMEDVKSFSHLITERPGGMGAVREVCELVLRAQDKWDAATRRYFE